MENLKKTYLLQLSKINRKTGHTDVLRRQLKPFNKNNPLLQPVVTITQGPKSLSSAGGTSFKASNSSHQHVGPDLAGSRDTIPTYPSCCEAEAFMGFVAVSVVGSIPPGYRQVSRTLSYLYPQTTWGQLTRVHHSKSRTVLENGSQPNYASRDTFRKWDSARLQEGICFCVLICIIVYGTKRFLCD